MNEPIRTVGTGRAATSVLDGFRGLAVLLVLVYHTWLFSWFTPELTIARVALPVDAIVRAGYLGVELFFAISAFVLFVPFARRAVTGEAGPAQSNADFALRRFVKIVPSYYLALAVTFVSAASLHIDVPYALTLLTHVFLTPNSYVSPLGQMNSVFWSLGTEVQFYLVFPWLARAFARRPVLVAVIMVAVAPAYRYALSTCCLTNEALNRQLPAYLDVFAAGMAAAYVVAYVERRYAMGARARAVASVLALAALAFAVRLALGASDVTYIADGREHWLLANRSLVALTAGTALAATIFAFAPVRALVENPLTRFFSLISYNLYLWHALVLIWLFKAHAIAAATANPYDDPHWKVAYIALGWTAAIAISTVLTYFVERPLLATIKPQTFAFDWGRLMPRSPAASSSETRT